MSELDEETALEPDIATENDEALVPLVGIDEGNAGTSSEPWEFVNCASWDLACIGCERRGEGSFIRLLEAGAGLKGAIIDGY